VTVSAKGKEKKCTGGRNKGATPGCSCDWCEVKRVNSRIRTQKYRSANVDKIATYSRTRWANLSPEEKYRIGQLRKTAPSVQQSGHLYAFRKKVKDSKIRELSTRRGEPWTLYEDSVVFSGLPYAEVAFKLGRSRQAVETRARNLRAAGLY